MTYHLAQVNIARMRGPIDDPVMAGFVAQLDAINALAEAAPGFVWRLQDAHGAATSIRVFNDPRFLINLSVWRDPESLRIFTYEQLDHRNAMRDRRQWFERIDHPHLALWWLPTGTWPTPEDGRRRLAHLASHGPSPYAFGFRDDYPPPAFPPTP